MNCDESQVLLHGYLDGELDSSGSVRTEPVIEIDADCLEERDEFEPSDDLVNSQ
jgi:hypothetical protein